jgi:hypothetical protein
MIDKRRFAAVLLTSALLLGGIATYGAPTYTQDGGLDTTEAVTEANALLIPSLGDGCGFFGLGACDEEPDESYEGTSTDELRSSIYSSAGSIKQGTDSIYETTETLTQRGENAVWSEAKVEIIEAHENGTAESKAKTRAVEVVEKRYTELQKTILDRMTTLSNELDTQNRTLADNDVTAISSTFQYDKSGSFGNVDYPDGDYEMANKSYTLVNEETYNYTEFEIQASGSSVPIFSHKIAIDDGNSETDLQVVVDGPRLTNLLDDISTNASDLRTNVEQYASDIYANYSTGELNSSDFLSAADIAQNYNIGSQNGTAYSTASAALLGYETNASTSVVIEYVDTGAELQGNLFSTDGAPTTYNVSTGNNSTTERQAWVKGHTYDVSEYSGSIYMATNDDWVTLDSDFEIINLEQATTGKQLNYTTDVTYSSVNTDATNLSRQLASLNAALDNRTEANDCGILCFGGGGGQGDGTLVFVLMLIGGIVLSLIVIIGIVYLARSD